MRFIGFICAVALVACESTPNAPAGATTTTTTTAYVTAVTNDHAIDEITEARCARELSCDNIGADREWPDYDACRRDVRLSMRDMAGGQTCTGGVDAVQLSSCINDIRNFHCAVTGTTTERFGACAEPRLCR